MPVLLNVITLVPVAESPDKAALFESCNVAVVAGATAKVEVVPAALVV